MGFSVAIGTALGKYFDFTGRATRPEYWYFFLFYLLANTAAAIVDVVVFQTDTGLFSLITGLGLFIPSLSVGTRRLHDIDRSGWWQLLSFIPIVGVILLIVWFCMPGSVGTNNFGDDPLFFDPPPPPPPVARPPNPGQTPIIRR